MGLSGLEPPTSRLSGVRSNQLSYKPIFFFKFGGHLLSHTVSSAVPSAVQVFTIVFGMGTGVAPERIATKNFRLLDNPTIDNSKIPLLLSSVLVGLFQMKGNISSVLVGLFQTKESISSLERR